MVTGEVDHNLERLVDQWKPQRVSSSAWVAAELGNEALQLSSTIRSCLKYVDSFSIVSI